MVGWVDCTSSAHILISGNTRSMTLRHQIRDGSAGFRDASLLSGQSLKPADDGVTVEWIELDQPSNAAALVCGN